MLSNMGWMFTPYLNYVPILIATELEPSPSTNPPVPIGVV